MKSGKDRVGPVVVRVLSVGIGFSAVLLAVGLISYLKANPGPVELVTAPADLAGVAVQAWALQPSALMTAGLLTLVGTPIIPLIAAAIAHARAGDHDYTLISMAVLLVVAIGIWLGNTLH